MAIATQAVTTGCKLLYMLTVVGRMARNESGSKKYETTVEKIKTTNKLTQAITGAGSNNIGQVAGVMDGIANGTHITLPIKNIHFISVMGEYRFEMVRVASR